MLFFQLFVFFNIFLLVLQSIPISGCSVFNRVYS